MDRVTSECARFLISQLDIASCLDLRSMPGVAPELFSVPDLGNNDKVWNNGLPSANNLNIRKTSEENRKIDLMSCVDEFIEGNMDLLGESRELRALPRICLEILHLTKEERDAAQLPRPLCELALDWLDILKR